MKRLLACAVWGAVALVPVAAGAMQTTVIAQTAAPVQIQSCSVDVTLAASMPMYDESSSQSGSTRPVATVYNGRIVSYAYSGSAAADPESVPQPVPISGTQVYATARSVNLSRKTVTGVVYEFNVLKADSSKPVAVFYGGRTGSFAENVVIWPSGHGLPPWSTNLSQMRVSSVACFIAYVRFSDGTDWTSPIAVLTK